VASSFEVFRQKFYTQSSYPVGLGALSLGVKRPGPEGDHSPPSSAEVKE